MSKTAHVNVGVFPVRDECREGGRFGHGKIKFDTYAAMIADKASWGNRFDNGVVMGSNKKVQSVLEYMRGEVDMLFKVERMKKRIKLDGVAGGGVVKMKVEIPSDDRRGSPR